MLLDHNDSTTGVVEEDVKQAEGQAVDVDELDDAPENVPDLPDAGADASGEVYDVCVLCNIRYVFLVHTMYRFMFLIFMMYNIHNYDTSFTFFWAIQCITS